LLAPAKDEPTANVAVATAIKATIAAIKKALPLIAPAV
jgi:hypothetical protein